MSVSRRGDALRGDARAPPAQARARVLPHRRPGSVQGDSELPEDDGEDGWADVSKNRADGPRGARAAGGLDGAPPLVLRPGVALAVLGARRRSALGAPAAGLLRERRSKARAAVLPRSRRGEPPRGAEKGVAPEPARSERRLHRRRLERLQRRPQRPQGDDEGEGARGEGHGVVRVQRQARGDRRRGGVRRARDGGAAPRPKVRRAPRRPPQALRPRRRRARRPRLPRRHRRRDGDLEWVPPAHVRRRRVEGARARRHCARRRRSVDRSRRDAPSRRIGRIGRIGARRRGGRVGHLGRARDRAASLRGRRRGARRGEVAPGADARQDPRGGGGGGARERGARRGGVARGALRGGPRQSRRGGGARPSRRDRGRVQGGRRARAELEAQTERLARATSR